MRNKKKDFSMPLLDLLSDEKIQIQDVESELIKEIQNFEYEKPKYRPIGKYPTFMLVIKNSEGKEVSHWSCEEPDVEEFKASEIKRNKSVEVYPTKEYWERYRNGEFQLK